MNEVCLLARIRGRVQGIGFRYHTRQQAQGLDIRGWVRNLPDGSVEACICGDPERIPAMRRWLAHGPDYASVTGVDYIEADPAVAGQDFVIL